MIPENRKKDGASGSRSNHDKIFLWYGHCKHNKIRSKDHKSLPDHDKCTTMVNAGIDIANLALLGKGTAAEINVEMWFTGCCVHRESDCEERLCGAAREAAKKQVSSIPIFVQTLGLRCVISSPFCCTKWGFIGMRKT